MAADFCPLIRARCKFEECVCYEPKTRVKANFRHETVETLSDPFYFDFSLNKEEALALVEEIKAKGCKKLSDLHPSYCPDFDQKKKELIKKAVETWQYDHGYTVSASCTYFNRKIGGEK